VFVRVFLFSSFIGAALAAPPAIGVVTASGHFTLERSEIWGNATLFDGATVETGAASSDLALRNGVRIQLGSASRASVFEQRVLLQKGVGQVIAPPSYEVDAAGLTIRGMAAGARVRVGIGDSVEVTALAGGARVSNRSGALLAAIPAGRRMSFSMQAGAAGQAGAAAMRTGCLLTKDGRFILQDDNTQEVIEVNGPDLALNVGNRVELTGRAGTARPSVAIATAVFDATSVAARSQGGCLSVAAALDARAQVTGSGGTTGGPTTGAETGKAPKGGGMSTGAKVAIVVAVAGGGAGGAIAAMGGKKSTSP
jgi:hypothetical protein